MRSTQFSRHTLSAAVAVALAMSLTACAGGGGSKSSNSGSTVSPSSPTTPTNPCTTNPNASGCQPTSPGTGTGTGGSGGTGGTGGSGGTTTPPPPTYTYPDYSHLVPTGALDAQKAGYTGQNVKIGVLDSGIDPALAPFNNRVASFQSYVTAGNQSPNDTTGHGSTITQAMAGTATTGFVGGVAPNASLYIAQVCDVNDNCVAYQQAYTDLDAKGVKLFNQSFGFYSATGNTVLGGQMQAEYQALVDKGDLFVWAAGNSGPSQLNYEAAAPVDVPTLQKGWLAVVNAAVDSNGNSTALDATSAQCGQAMMWCLAAPGSLKTLADGKFNTGYSDGTSGSTAVVTGAAALVWQAYPWMSGTNVQQTLLTTATPMGGTTGPNPTFGWGMVNAAKAVYGPAQFAFGEFDADVVDQHSTFQNAISGTGSLSLSGTSGSLTLAAANTYTGGTTINGATLILPGSLGSDVTIKGGALSGDGTVNGNVNNMAGALVSQSATAGKGLHITGNYSVQAGGTTAVSLGNPVQVDGAASLAGTVQILAPNSTYTPSATETILKAGSLTGTFSNQTYGQSVFYTATLAYGANAVTASVQRQSVAQSFVVAAPNAVNAAQGIESALKQADQWSTTDYANHAQFLGTAAQFLGATTQSEALQSVQSLNGEIYGTTGVIEAKQAKLVDDALALRQNGIANGSKPGVWVQALAANGDLYQSGFASARYHNDGALFGIESSFNDQFGAGVALGRSYMNASLSGLAGNVKGRDDTLAFYGRYAFNDGTYLAGRTSWSRERLQVDRQALIGGNTLALGSTRTDDIGSATLELGKQFTAGGAFLTPYVAVSAVRIDQAGFTETGGNGFGLTGKSNTQNATTGDLGVRYGHAFDWTGGRSVLTGYLAYRRVFSGQSMDFTAALTGAPTATFTAVGQEMARNTGQVGVNWTTTVNDRWDWFLNFDAQAARGMDHGIAGSAGFRVHF